MFQPKPISKDAIPAALMKAERYRLLNEPGEAESICLDILQIEPSQPGGPGVAGPGAQRPVPRRDRLVPHCRGTRRRVPVAPHDEYDRLYYSGLIRERRAKAVLQRDRYAAPHAAEWLREAMHFFERAEAVRPSHNDDAVLRWNACAPVAAASARAAADGPGRARAERIVGHLKRKPRGELDLARRVRRERLAERHAIDEAVGELEVRCGSAR